MLCFPGLKIHAFSTERPTFWFCTQNDVVGPGGNCCESKWEGSRERQSNSVRPVCRAGLWGQVEGREGGWKRLSLQENRHKMEPRTRQAEEPSVFQNPSSSARLPALWCISQTSNSLKPERPLLLLCAPCGVVERPCSPPPYSCSWLTTGPAAMLRKAGSRRRQWLICTFRKLEGK